MSLLSNIWQYIQNLVNEIMTDHTPTPQPSSHQPNDGGLNRLTQIIIANNAPFKTFYPPVTGTQPNAEIHKISTETATQMASAILANAHLVNDDSDYLAACIKQESRFDPACYNHNLAEYNGVESFEGTDWGCCQMSGYYLPTKPGMQGLTEAEMSAKAMSIEWAVPEMASVMHDNLTQANNDLYAAQTALTALQSQLRDGTDIKMAAQINAKIDANLITIMKSLNTTPLSNEQFLATLYYNRGASGGLKFVLEKSMSDIQHPFAVGKWYGQFKAVPA
jgi:hypothetical protein